LNNLKGVEMDGYKVKAGLRVVTVNNLHDSQSIGIGEEPDHGFRKSNEKGIVEQPAAADGYLWWVRHTNNMFGLYGSDEFELEEGYLYAIDYFWRDGEFLKVGRIISSNPESLEKEVRKLTKGEHCSISATYGPFETEDDAQRDSGPFFGPHS